MNDRLFLTEEYYKKIHQNYLDSFDVKYSVVENIEDIKFTEEKINLLLNENA